jgi:hypothetical protein
MKRTSLALTAFGSFVTLFLASQGSACSGAAGSGSTQDTGGPPDTGSWQQGAADAEVHATGDAASAPPNFGDAAEHDAASESSALDSPAEKDVAASDAHADAVAEACPLTEAVCPDGCQNLASSNTDCGICGRSCAGGTCNSGLCICPTGDIACGDGCANLATSTTDCGVCGHACGSGQTCASGICQ